MARFWAEALGWQVRPYDDAETLGATVVQRQPDWIVIADPEGNEFCVLHQGSL